MTEQELLNQNNDTFRDEGSDDIKLKGKTRAAEARGFFVNIIVWVKEQLAGKADLVDGKLKLDQVPEGIGAGTINTVNDQLPDPNKNVLIGAEHIDVTVNDTTWWGVLKLKINTALDRLASEIKLLKTSQQPAAIFDDNLEDGTNSLTLSSGWAQSTDGIAISTGGGWSNSAVWNKYTTIDRTATRARVQLVDAASVFSLIRKPPASVASMGTVVEVNGTLNKIRYYASWDGTTTAPAVSKELTLPFALVAGREYLCELVKDKVKHTFNLVDTVTQQKATLVYDNAVEASLAGRQWGAPGVMFHSGSIKLKRLTYATPFKLKPRILITGHSFVEGYALLTSGMSTYANLLYTETGGEVAIAGRGGETISTLNEREDINLFKPAYHLVDIGANDTDYNVWLAGLQTYLGKITATGAIPVLFTIVPRADRQAFINQANAWIRSSGYNYIDSAKAVTTNNDGVTQNSSLFAADGVHPNTAGNAKIFEQIKIDAPYILDGTAPLAAASSTSPLTALSTNAQFASYTLAGSDAFKQVSLSSASAVTLTVPPNTAETTNYSVGTQIKIKQAAAGVVTLAAGAGVVLNAPDGRNKLRSQYSTALLTYEGGNVWNVEGDIVL